MGVFLAFLRYSARDQSAVRHFLLFFLGACVGLLLLLWYARHPFLLSGALPFDSADFLPYFRAYLRPEPIEGHLYHLGFPLVLVASFLAWVCGIAFLARSHGQQTVPAWLSGGAVLASGLLVASLLPLVDAVTVRELLRHTAFGVHPVIFLATALVLAWWIVRPAWIPRFRAFVAIECVAVFGLLVLVFFDPQYRGASLLYNAGYHVWFFLAPVHDVLQGKHLLVDTGSQYGVLLIQALALLFRWAVPFSFPHFTAILMALSVLYHFFLYLLLRALFRDRFLALLGILLVVSAGFLRHAAFTFPGEPYVAPSVLKLRFLFDLPVMALFLWHARRRAIAALPLAAVLCAVAVLWNGETGISLCAAYLAYVLIDALRAHARAIIALRRIVLHTALLAASIAAIVGLFAWWTLAASGSLPDFSSIPSYMRLYYSGFGALPMPVIGAWSVPLLLYAVVLLQAARRMLLGGTDAAVRGSEEPSGSRRETALRAGWAVYGLMIFHYYISHSASTNLSAVTVPAIVLGLWLLDDIRPWLQRALPARGSAAALLALVFLISLELTAGVAMARDVLLKRWASPALLLWTGMEQDDPRLAGFPLPADRYVRTAEAVRALVPAPLRPLILSQQDFLHLWVLDSTNALSFPYQCTVASMREARAIERQIDQLAPRYVFLDPLSSDIDAVPPCALCEALRPFVRRTYIFRRNIGLLDVYERRSPAIP